MQLIIARFLRGELFYYADEKLIKMSHDPIIPKMARFLALFIFIDSILLFLANSTTTTFNTISTSITTTNNNNNKNKNDNNNNNNNNNNKKKKKKKKKKIDDNTSHDILVSTQDTN